jgi:hypothetical protein
LHEPKGTLALGRQSKRAPDQTQEIEKARELKGRLKPGPKKKESQGGNSPMSKPLDKAGVWKGDWSSFLSEKAIPETQKYLVLATWQEEEQDHSCRYPVVATSDNDAVTHVRDFEAARSAPLFGSGEDVNFQVLPVSMVDRKQLDYLLRTDREQKIQ